MVVLYQIPGAWGVSSVSPFCIKAEAFLRMSGLPFESKFGDPRKAPRAKVPWIDDAGTIVADSQLIIEHLTAHHGVQLDSRLTPEQKVLGHAIRRMLEEATYFGLVWLRWGNDEGWAAYKPIMLGFAPKVIGGPIMAMIRRSIVKSMAAQGIGRFEPAQINDLMKRDFGVVAEALGDKPYLFGDEPTSFDATLYGFFASLVAFPADSAARAWGLSQKNLVAHKARIEARYFQDGGSK